MERGLIKVLAKKNEGLTKWFKENWVDISRKDEDGKHPACGRGEAKGDKSDYPVCRPAAKAAAMTPAQKAYRTKKKRSKPQAKDGKPTTVRVKQKLEAQVRKPTYSCAVLTTQSSCQLYNMLKALKVPVNLLPSEFHVTIVYSTKAISYQPGLDFFPIVLDPLTYSYDLFGEKKDHLVLKINHENLQQLHKRSREEFGASYDFPEYLPHITLAKDVQDIDLNALILPNMPIILKTEIMRDLDD
jgi:hypothetical protein